MSRFLRPATSILVIVGRREAAFIGSATRSVAVGTTLVFDLTTVIDDIKPLGTFKCESHCYELEKVNMQVRLFCPKIFFAFVR